MNEKLKTILLIIIITSFVIILSLILSIFQSIITLLLLPLFFIILSIFFIGINYKLEEKNKSLIKRNMGRLVIVYFLYSLIGLFLSELFYIIEYTEIVLDSTILHSLICVGMSFILITRILKKLSVTKTMNEMFRIYFDVILSILVIGIIGIWGISMDVDFHNVSIDEIFFKSFTLAPVFTILDFIIMVILNKKKKKVNEILKKMTNLFSEFEKNLL
ncbi:MAG: hypothetical protein COY38_02530 [Candidatus Aenigmarchaeota archaeon CG_4_10_14_0_8_um_filter_37_24]|nr:MAG: hypothetical protein COS07_01225 [Candidatus Aenigmarchaeota archaeon CG01_land_8_20_14_3_00_37_9]PIW41501.1 MAG: hypothetical protein COW21_01575 [Candidatus Aenigmarchaeota archaeon CG15_BIG_FIL_POST_REV_8_21_14_020_37_27]PIY34869.1 MAG: hypothetical protein COZ04_05330 [Candidatus Aenigmarchaeota archaeon CG_4_10_14_3_um_filter_37_21]PIZ35317.1 MAG: hypothetical protein COY38_02530 [Candidatus Aenigmarchaeota archaeon CG_4_10_14_0_8_um_filter_37_24]